MMVGGAVPKDAITTVGGNVRYFRSRSCPRLSDIDPGHDRDRPYLAAAVRCRKPALRVADMMQSRFLDRIAFSWVAELGAELQAPLNLIDCTALDHAELEQVSHWKPPHGRRADLQLLGLKPLRRRPH
jgi:hypothetical protein